MAIWFLGTSAPAETMRSTSSFQSAGVCPAPVMRREGVAGGAGGFDDGFRVAGGQRLLLSERSRAEDDSGQDERWVLHVDLLATNGILYNVMRPMR